MLRRALSMSATSSGVDEAFYSRDGIEWSSTLELFILRNLPVAVPSTCREISASKSTSLVLTVLQFERFQ